MQPKGLAAAAQLQLEPLQGQGDLGPSGDDPGEALFLLAKGDGLGFLQVQLGQFTGQAPGLLFIAQGIDET